MLCEDRVECDERSGVEYCEDIVRRLGWNILGGLVEFWKD
jgi:hypothetical protein